MQGLRQVVRLAARDFRHDWRVSVCLCLALAAVMAPLLVLFGLKSGIVTTLQTRLLSDPRNREVVIVGSYTLGPDWFAAIGQDRRVEVVIPRTRSLAATLDVRAPSGKALPGLELVPTAGGDPLIPPALRQQGLPSDAVFLTQAAAAQLAARTGDVLVGQVTRTVQGKTEVQRWSLRVAGVVPETLFPRAALFAGVDFLVEAEDWRDGGSGPVAAQRSFASARLFAKGLEDVAPLAEQLRQQGMEIRTRAAEIDSVQALDRGLTRIFAVLAVLGVSGFVLSLAASLWAAVERKRRDLALLRLVGVDGVALALVPVTQAVLVALGGIVLSTGLYGAVSALFNVTLAETLAREEFVCRLDPVHYALAVGLTVLLSALSAAVAASRALGIDPAESLREV